MLTTQSGLLLTCNQPIPLYSLHTHKSWNRRQSFGTVWAPYLCPSYWQLAQQFPQRSTADAFDTHSSDPPVQPVWPQPGRTQSHYPQMGLIMLHTHTRDANGGWDRNACLISTHPDRFCTLLPSTGQRTILEKSQRQVMIGQFVVSLRLHFFE